MTVQFKKPKKQQANPAAQNTIHEAESQDETESVNQSVNLLGLEDFDKPREEEKKEEHEGFPDNFDDLISQNQQSSRFTGYQDAEEEEEVKEEEVVVPQDDQRARKLPTRIQAKIDVEVSQTFKYHILSDNTPLEVLHDMFMKPIPKLMGTLQCTVERAKQGFMNKMEPKFSLTLTQTK